MASSTLRVPPQSLESERGLLGALLLKPDAIHDVSDIVRPDSFYAEKHKMIFEAMRDLSERGEPIDILTLSERMTARGTLDRVGGRAYIADLANSAPSPGNFAHYAELVARKHVTRALINAANDISEACYDESRETTHLLDEAEKMIMAIGNGASVHKFVAIKDKIGEAWDRIEALSKKDDGIRGTPTGFSDLDSLLSGLHPSDLIILAARPSVGKTSFALDIARNAAVRHNVPVGIFSLEMSSEQIIDRMLSAESAVNSWKIRTGAVSAEEDFGRIRDALETLSKAPIYIDDKPGNNILAMRAVARRLKREQGIGLIIVDYLQLMSPTNSKGTDSVVQQVTEISRSLKGLARELNVPVLALSQLSRAVEQRGGKPRLSDLRDSGCLTGDTLVQRADTGERVRIDSLMGEENIPLVSLDAAYQLRPMLASKVFSSGVKEVFELTLRSGRRIKASANHKFLSFEGWQRLDALQEGDRLALPRLLTATNPTSSLSTQELVLLAHLVGNEESLPCYVSTDEKNATAVAHALSEVFAIAVDKDEYEGSWRIPVPSQQVLPWCAQHGIDTELKRVPQAVFAADSMSIQLFLHHLWATGGTISWKQQEGRRPSALIHYTTSNRGLAEDVQHLLLRLGIWSSVTEAVSGTFHVHVQSAPVQKRFLELVGSFGAPGAHVPELIKALEEIAPVPNTDTIPSAVWDLFAEAPSTSVETSYNGSAVVTASVPRTRLAALKHQHLTHLAESDVYWDELVSVTPLGTQEVFDATVPGTHNFVAGDILVHNSIEQDADVVMFIHREDKGNPDSDRANIAEILVEKHRNGPTGRVELYFDGKRTTFMTVDKSGYGDLASEF